MQVEVATLLQSRPDISPQNIDSVVPIDPALLDEDVNNNGNNTTSQMKGRQSSNSSDEDVRSALLPKASNTRSGKKPERNEYQALEQDAARYLTKMLGDIAKLTSMAVRAGEDKVALAMTAYDWVRLSSICLSLLLWLTCVLMVLGGPPYKAIRL